MIDYSNEVALWCTAISAKYVQDSKIHGTNMWPTWVLPAPDGPHVGPMNLVIGDILPMGQSVDIVLSS